jgi:Escherichia/Staphylococcus phage prohead protease
MIERRSGAELRATGRRLEGYAATYNPPATVMDFREIIKPGAFATTLRSGRDVVFLVDHQPSQLLARTRNGSLKLAEDQRGLIFSADLPSTTLANDVLALAEARSLGGMSFGFTVIDESWPSRNERELHSVQLLEISTVAAWPAYDGTTVSARARPLERGIDRTLLRLRLSLTGI